MAEHEVMWEFSFSVNNLRQHLSKKNSSSQDWMIDTVRSVSLALGTSAFGFKFLKNFLLRHFSTDSYNLSAIKFYVGLPEWPLTESVQSECLPLLASDWLGTLTNKSNKSESVIALLDSDSLDTNRLCRNLSLLKIVLPFGINLSVLSATTNN